MRRVAKVPNAERAIIAAEKLREYLLNPEHKRGAAKARFLMACGYDQENWQRLAIDLRDQHLICDASATLEMNTANAL